jgi:cation transport regulator ChaC
MLHFAYGSNMDRAVMRKHAPCAEPLGVAALKDYRFVITADGYASVELVRTAAVYGVVWRITPGDRITLDRWECTASGQYRAAMLQVLVAGSCRPALVYVGRPRGHGKPRASYMDLVLAAARSWKLPPRYVASLQHWVPAQPLGAGARNLKKFGWT